MTLNESKAQARSEFLNAKAAYIDSPTSENWKAFCDAKRICMRLGVLV